MFLFRIKLHSVNNKVTKQDPHSTTQKSFSCFHKIKINFNVLILPTMRVISPLMNPACVTRNRARVLVLPHQNQMGADLCICQPAFGCFCAPAGFAQLQQKLEIASIFRIYQPVLVPVHKTKAFPL